MTVSRKRSKAKGGSTHAQFPHWYQGTIITACFVDIQLSLYEINLWELVSKNIVSGVISAGSIITTSLFFLALRNPTASRGFMAEYWYIFMSQSLCRASSAIIGMGRCTHLWISCAPQLSIVLSNKITTLWCSAHIISDNFHMYNTRSLMILILSRNINHKHAATLSS